MSLIIIDVNTGLGSKLSAEFRAPFYYVLDIPLRLFYSLSVNFLAKQDLLAQNAALQTKIIELQAQQSYLTNTLKENELLRELLSSSSRVKAEFTHAEIIAITNAVGRNIVIINKGKVDDVKEGQALVDAFGVFGHVIDVGEYTSQVLLITDKDSYIPIQNDSGLRAIVAGVGGYDHLEIIDTTATTKFKVGDKLYTSGLALRYMPGYPVGVIESIEARDSNDFAIIKVKPLAKINSSRQLLLVWLQENKITKEARSNYNANKYIN